MHRIPVVSGLFCHAGVPRTPDMPPLSNGKMTGELSGRMLTKVPSLHLPGVPRTPDLLPLSNGKMTGELRGRILTKVPSLHLPGGTEKSHKDGNQNSRWSGQNSNQGPTVYMSRTLPLPHLARYIILVFVCPTACFVCRTKHSGYQLNLVLESLD
jgi:hypothetical protein